LSINYDIIISTSYPLKSHCVPLENLKAHNTNNVNEITSSMHHGNRNASNNGVNQYFHNNQIQSSFCNANNTQNVHKFVQSINVQFSKIFVNSGEYKVNLFGFVSKNKR